jgi:predicted dehydrogenase
MFAAGFSPRQRPAPIGYDDDMSVPSAVVDVAVVGVGRMGKHHARTYSKIPQARLVAVVDADEDRAGAVADEYGCEVCTSVEQLLERFPQVRAATVAVPTAHHAAAAMPLLARRVACLIEKPLAATVNEARELAQFAQRHGAVLQVGHTERFNPAVRSVEALDITPRFMEVDRISPMTFRSLDVGVVMDMMIHDLDIVLTLSKSDLVKVDAAGVAVLGKHEDVANARLVFANGCVANLTASRLALKTERKLRVFSESAYVSLDYQRRNGVIIRKSVENARVLDEVRSQLEKGQDLTQLDYGQLVKVEELTMDPAAGSSDPLTAQLTSFLSTVLEGGKPVVDAQAGYAAVEAAERVVRAIHEHRWEGLTQFRV